MFHSGLPTTALGGFNYEMVHNANDAIHGGQIIDPIVKLQTFCLTRGADGILALGRTFRRMTDGDTLNQDQFAQGLTEAQFEISDDECQEMFRAFDTAGNGSLNLTDFINTVRPTMADNRNEILEKAFKKLDKDDNGMITYAAMKRVYSVQEHPLYKCGDMSKEEIFQKFIGHFESGGIVDGHVTHEEFFNYYAAISASVENDSFFDLMIRQAYKL